MSTLQGESKLSEHFFSHQKIGFCAVKNYFGSFIQSNLHKSCRANSEARLL